MRIKRKHFFAGKIFHHHKILTNAPRRGKAGPTESTFGQVCLMCYKLQDQVRVTKIEKKKTKN